MQAESTMPEALTPPVTLRLSGELIAYSVLVLFALVVRLADIDIVTLIPSEAQRAVATWHVIQPDAPGNAQIPDSPILFWWQAISFSFLGGSEFAARLGGIVGGIILMLMPILFRERIGHARAFLMSLILACSPIALAASRLSEPVIWTVICALAGLWALWRWWDTRHQPDALLAGVFFGAMIFLSDFSGPLLALVLLGAGLIALWWTVYDAPEERDTPGDDVLQNARQTLSSLPLLPMFGLMVLVVMVVATGFMLYPAGLGHVGQLLGNLLTGFTQSPNPNAPPAYALLSLLVYDPLLLIFGALGFVTLVLRADMNYRERFVAAMLVLAILVLGIYLGAGAAHALWLVVPLAWLTTYLANELITNRSMILFWLDDISDQDATRYDEETAVVVRYWWVKWAIAIIILGLLIMLAVHWQEVGRGLLMLQPGIGLSETWQRMTEPALVQFRYSLIWFFITGMFMIVSYFLAASIYGNINTLQGYGIGLFVFMLVSGVGGGWNAAVTNATSPAEFWHFSASSPDAALLRETLNEVAQRDTGGFNAYLPVTVVTDGDIIRDDGLMAWLLRDFEDALFIASLENARRDEIIIMPVTEETIGQDSITEPDLGGSYVGQSFQLQRHWSLAQLPVIDAPAWLAQRRIRNQTLQEDTAILWLRIDVYDGLNPAERP